MSSLLRSTKFVRYFTGAARTLILNSAKTAEVNLIGNSKLLCTNNALMRDYAATAKKTDNLEPLLQKLDSDVRKFGRITKRDIDEVFDEIRTKHDITSSQSLLVIRCCGELVPEELPEQRTLLVQKIWNVLTERGIPMDISHYNALLRVYLENEHEFSPAQFLDELEKKGLQPNRVTYQRLMWRYCQEGDVEGATKVLERMRELSLPVSEPVLNALVMGHAFRGDTDGAKVVMETMENAGLKPTNRTYTLLSCGYAKQGDIESIKNIIKSASDKDAYMTDKDILDIIEQLAVSGHADKVEQLFEYLQKGTGYNQDVCNLILKLINKGHEQTAKEIMKTMSKVITDTIFKGAFFVKQLLRVKKPAEDVIKTCKELQEEGLVPNALYIATEGALQQGHTELAQSLFKELKKNGIEIRQHYYWPLLAQKGKENDEEGLMQILREMSTEGVSPSGEALRDYVIPYLINKDPPQTIILKLQIANVPVVHSARNLMVELLESTKIKEAVNIALKYCPRGQYSLVARSLLNALYRTKDVDSFVSILHVISSQPTLLNEEHIVNEDAQIDDKVNSNEIGRIVKSGVKILVRPELCEKLLVAIHSKGLRIDTQSAEAIEQYLGNNMTTKISELLSQLTSSDLEMVPVDITHRESGSRTANQLEQLISKIQSKGDNNVNRLQKQLLLAYIKEKNVEKLKTYVNELDSSKFDINIVILAQMFEFYCQNDDIESAYEVKAKIAAKDPEFPLNRIKLVEMAYALIRANKFEEAIKFLAENKPRNEDSLPSNFLLKSKCWQMLNHLAESKDVNKVKEMTKLLIEKDFVEPSNVLLGPCIKVHLLQNDVDGALAEFENCCKSYRSTPWKGELMKTLINKEDASKLQWLADLGTQIHGEVNILHDLVLAFVECGRLRQARRILETPGLQTRNKRLNDACQRYVEEGKSEYLEGLLEATKELSHIDRSNIFYNLLVTYCKANETDKALGLWTILQEETEVPSDQFLIYLANHLKSKNREVPFVVPQETQSYNKKVAQETSTTAPKSERPQVNLNIETLVKEGKPTKAMDYALKMIDEGVMPKSNVLKYILRNLADMGEVEKIELFGKRIDDAMRRKVTYDDKLTLAIFRRGAGKQHVDSVLQSVQNANTADELEQALTRYPRSNALEIAVKDEELGNKCRKIAELAASRGKTMPANLLWMEYILAEKNEEADSLWNQCLKNNNSVVFRRLLQESHASKRPQLIEKLISTLASNDKISLGSIGNAYSRLINFYLADNNIQDAKIAFEKSLESGVKPEHFNSNCLKRLKSAMEAVGQKFDYTV